MIRNILLLIVFYVALNVSVTWADTGYVKKSYGCSGSLISNSGHVVTASHCVEDMKYIEVIYKGKRWKAHVVYAGRSNDIAVIQTDIRGNYFYRLALAPHRKSFNITTVGYPAPDRFGYDIKFHNSTGYVDILGRSNIHDGRIQGGLSGGAVLDSEGRLIGVVTAAYDASIRPDGYLSEGVFVGVQHISDVVEKYIDLQKILPPSRSKSGWISSSEREFIEDNEVTVLLRMEKYEVQ